MKDVDLEPPYHQVALQNEMELCSAAVPRVVHAIRTHHGAAVPIGVGFEVLEGVGSENAEEIEHLLRAGEHRRAGDEDAALGLDQNWNQIFRSFCIPIFQVVRLVSNRCLEVLLFDRLRQPRRQVITQDEYLVAVRKAFFAAFEEVDVLLSNRRDPLQYLVAPRKFETRRADD